MNAANKDANWPIIGEKPKEEKKDGEKDKEKEKTKEAVKEVGKEIKKSLEEQYADKLKEEKLKYKNEQKFNSWKEKQEAKKAKKEGTDDQGDSDDDGEGYNIVNTKYVKDFDDKNIWNSVEQASANSKPISDDLTPAEQAFLDSFKKR